MAQSVNNIMSTVSWTFTTETGDAAGPIVENRVPAPDDIGVDVQPTIDFDVTDLPSGVDLATLDVTVEGVPAVTGGVVQAGFSGAVTVIANGYNVSITPDVAYAREQIIDVSVDVDDTATVPNNSVTNWSFRTISNTISFTQRAFRALTPGYVLWEVTGSPDTDGSQSGFPPVELTDIVIISRNSFDTIYTHRAFRALSSEYVYWEATAPDPTATFAPYPLAQLSDIVVANSRAPETPFVEIGDYPTTLQPVLSQAFSQSVSVDNPAAGPLTFSLFAGTLPDGLSVNPTTGTIEGTPTITALLTNSGLYTGIQVEVTDGFSSDQSNAFTIDVQGVDIPVPDFYANMDSNGNDQVGGHSAPTATGVTFPGSNGNISGAGDFAGGTSNLNYGDDPTYRINGNTALTVSATVNPDSFAVGARIADNNNNTTNGVGWEFGVFSSSASFSVRQATTDSAQVTTAGIPTGTWTQVSATHVVANNRADIYIEGALAPLSTDIVGVGAPGDDTGRDLLVGNTASLNRGLDGRMDELAIWNVELDADQHATLGWLKLRQVTILGWANQVPAAPIYADREITVAQAATITPTTPASDPEDATITYSVSTGTLPDGMSLDTGTGSIGGTPTAAALVGGTGGDYTIAVSADDGVNVVEGPTFTISIRGVEVPVPLAYYPLDLLTSTQGTYLDPAGEHHVTINGTPTSVAGNVGEALDFTTDDANFLDIDPAPVALNISGDMTVAWTHFITTLPHFQPTVGSGGDGEDAATNYQYLYGVNSDGTVNLFHEFGSGSDESEDTDNTVTLSQWENIVIVRDVAAQEWQPYFDGLPDTIKTFSSNPSGGSGAIFRIGRSSLAATRYENLLDEIAVWDTRLTALQAATVAWLSIRGESLASWIRDNPPVGALYNDQDVQGPVQLVAAEFDVLPSAAEGWTYSHEPTSAEATHVTNNADGTFNIDDDTVTGTPGEGISLYSQDHGFTPAAGDRILFDWRMQVNTDSGSNYNNSVRISNGFFNVAVTMKAALTQFFNDSTGAAVGSSFAIAAGFHAYRLELVHTDGIGNGTANLYVDGSLALTQPISTFSASGTTTASFGMRDENGTGDGDWDYVRVFSSEVASFTPVATGFDPEAEAVTYIAYDPLPTGFTLNSLTGEISGSASAASLDSIRIAVSDGANLTIGSPFDLNVYDPNGTLILEDFDILNGGSSLSSLALEILN